MKKDWKRLVTGTLRQPGHLVSLADPGLQEKQHHPSTTPDKGLGWTWQMGASGRLPASKCTRGRGQCLVGGPPPNMSERMKPVWSGLAQLLGAWIF